MIAPGLSLIAMAKLVTCIVRRVDKTWDVTWTSDGSTPPDFCGDNLTSVTDRAASAVASLYPDWPEAELQFAIYPWSGNPGNVILDIQRSADGFVARDIQGSRRPVQGSSLEELVLDAERRLPDIHEAMLRWIRPISELIGEAGERDIGGFDPLEAAAAVSDRLGASGTPVTAADVVAVMSAHAELTGHGDPEADRVQRSASVARIASTTGCSPDIVARIYDEVERYLNLHRPGA